ncbi:hypothetical protein ACWD7C_25360 [Streptomyces sp. NPDC005134]|uniref:hypothetical protein n=1 Tax=Streptomyces sp. NPDC005098 TaxID=3154560 RepID=UPI0033B01689
MCGVATAVLPLVADSDVPLPLLVALLFCGPSLLMSRWRAQPRYVAADELFVLLSDDTNAVGVTAAAERAAQDPADMDRLREIFDRRPKRAGQPVR